MYELTIHSSDEADAPRSRCSDGIATLRMVSSMVANTTVTETIASVHQRHFLGAIISVS